MREKGDEQECIRAPMQMPWPPPERYQSIEEIEAARDRDLTGHQLLNARAIARIAQYERERAQLEDEAEYFANEKMPRKPPDRLATNKALLQQQEKIRADAQLKILHIHKSYDVLRQRIQEFQEIEEIRRSFPRPDLVSSPKVSFDAVVSKQRPTILPERRVPASDNAFCERESGADEDQRHATSSVGFPKWREVA